ncbi:uncharacterized protein SPSK_02790 [Sporothrix schenckii 1099-18]|uniref:Uncharacterized protein n=1 Tax=Sporothrix schenckii 1099-18 TaxID=1397361 RepID=A0A0F2MAA1_SPOSC|nr:uncharacterized protein SPSK_02790 [Sporothrix schenckii 1099-18]KJR86567.1 hypothetical protein SPSK_02790 [Sporothrix schenckii 1099-18]
MAWSLVEGRWNRWSRGLARRLMIVISPRTSQTFLRSKLEHFGVEKARARTPYPSVLTIVVSGNGEKGVSRGRQYAQTGYRREGWGWTWPLFVRTCLIQRSRAPAKRNSFWAEADRGVRWFFPRLSALSLAVHSPWRASAGKHPPPPASFLPCVLQNREHADQRHDNTTVNNAQAL